jgi:transposase
MQRRIGSLRGTVPDGPEEIRTLARTLIERAADILAYFDRPDTSDGSAEAVNGRLEHLRGITLGSRNLSHYTIRSLVHTGHSRTTSKQTPKLPIDSIYHCLKHEERIIPSTAPATTLPNLTQPADERSR